MIKILFRVMFVFSIVFVWYETGATMETSPCEASGATKLKICKYTYPDNTVGHCGQVYCKDDGTDGNCQTNPSTPIRCKLADEWKDCHKCNDPY